ncbi:MAG: hypothetical protein JNK38_21790 [Acidobacteria bacterium]|nr:hypothetical protein [Acidobacteriota bacterium]
MIKTANTGIAAVIKEKTPGTGIAQIQDERCRLTDLKDQHAGDELTVASKT